MTHDEAVTRLKIYIGQRTDVSTDLISAMLNERMKMIAVPFKFDEHETTGTLVTVDGQDTIPLPNAYVIESVVDLTNNRPLEYVDFSEYAEEDQLYEGLPLGYTFYSSSLYLLPTPNGVYSLRWYGFALPSASGATELPFPVDWHPMIVKYTASDILFMVGNNERAMTLKNEALGDLGTRQEKRTIRRRKGSGQVSVERNFFRKHGVRRGRKEVDW